MPLNELPSFLCRTGCQIHYLKCSFRSAAPLVLLTLAERHLHSGSTEMTGQCQKYICTASTHGWIFFYIVLILPFFFLFKIKRVLETKAVQKPESGMEEMEMGEGS